MKEFFWFAMFLAVCAAAELAEDYRSERCVDHGVTWVKVHGCDSDYCDRSPKGSVK